METEFGCLLSLFMPLFVWQTLHGDGRAQIRGSRREGGRGWEGGVYLSDMSSSRGIVYG